MRPRPRSRARRATPLVTTAGMGLAAVAAPPRTLAENNGLAVSAPLTGWSSWCFLRSSPTAAKDEASALVSSGHGYDYINQDDLWYDCPGAENTPIEGTSYTASEIADGTARTPTTATACGGSTTVRQARRRSSTPGTMSSPPGA